MLAQAIAKALSEERREAGKGEIPSSFESKRFAETYAMK